MYKIREKYKGKSVRIATAKEFKGKKIFVLNENISQDELAHCYKQKGNDKFIELIDGNGNIGDLSKKTTGKKQLKNK